MVKPKTTKTVQFSALPGVRVSGEIVVQGKKRWVSVSTEGMTCDTFAIKIESDGDGLSGDEVVKALRSMFAIVREALLEEFGNLETAVQIPKSGPVV